ncbi:unnamed protein product [Boreogadus saida]
MYSKRYREPVDIKVLTVSGSSAFGQVSPNQADWGSVGALRRRLVGDGGNGHPGPTLGLVRAVVYGAGCHNPHSRRLLGGSAFNPPNPRKLSHPFGRRPEDQLRLRKAELIQRSYSGSWADPGRTRVGSLYADAPFTEDGSAHCQIADPERIHFGYLDADAPFTLSHSAHL